MFSERINLLHIIFQKLYNGHEKNGYHPQRCKCCPSVIPNQSNKIKINKNDYNRHRLKQQKQN